MTMKLNYEQTVDFLKDLKKLGRKYRTLPEDLETVKKAAIELYHINKIDNRSVFPIQGFCRDDVQILKVKKVACRSLKGTGKNSGIRIIYAFFPYRNRVVFIEIYYKGKREEENKERIKSFLSNLAKE